MTFRDPCSSGLHALLSRVYYYVCYPACMYYICTCVRFGAHYLGGGGGGVAQFRTDFTEHAQQRGMMITHIFPRHARLGFCPPFGLYPPCLPPTRQRYEAEKNLYL